MMVFWSTPRLCAPLVRKVAPVWTVTTLNWENGFTYHPPALTRSVPPLIVTPPEKFLLPASSSVAPPFFTSPSAPR